jgi:hypothetical protein
VEKQALFEGTGGEVPSLEKETTLFWGSSKTFPKSTRSPSSWRQHGPPKRRYLPIKRVTMWCSHPENHDLDNKRHETTKLKRQNLLKEETEVPDILKDRQNKINIRHL